MTAHITVLPLDVIETLSATLERNEWGNVPLAFMRLPHPRTGLPSLFLSSETRSDTCLSTKCQILEVQAVVPPETRSWFLGEEVVADGKLLIMTPIDPVFLLIPILQAAHPNDGSIRSFRPIDDIFEDASHQLETHAITDDTSIHGGDIIRFGSLKCVKDNLLHICDIKEVTPEITVYRFSQTKVLAFLRAKVTRLSAPEALEVSKTAIRALAKDGLMEDGKETLLQAGRIKAGCDLIGHYLLPDTRALLQDSYDFRDLDTYLTRELAVIETSGGKSKEKSTSGEEKKRKSTKGSQGVEKLKKVNVNGMAKLSSFFKKV